HAADLGIALVEVLAYTADYLSYYQDAVATEAYLGTARKRISVRRHTRLLDYFLHEGCNARAWICVQSNISFTIPAASFFATGLNNALAAEQTILSPAALSSVAAGDYESFEPVIPGDIAIHAAQSVIYFYSWGRKECSVNQGSTSATLLDYWT